MEKAPPATLAEVRAELEQLARVRRTISADSCGGVREFTKRVSELWAAEAKVWATLSAVVDFPLGTPGGALLTLAAGRAAELADARSVGWLRTGGREPEPTSVPS
ncbi:hypothetical protein BJF78_24660 [Pseudonocardia sp. CNS-139]|nr:hypothetical protein BJF78_24660 [Pseudonocardia sp. CNS-139]